MKLTNLTLGSLLVLSILSACKSSNEKPVLGIIGSGDFESADSTFVYDPVKKESAENVIRTAHMKIKVKDVKKSVSRFESLAKSVGGFVEFTNIESSEVRNTSKTVSEDSSLQVMEYSISGDIILRVPVYYFDTIVNAVQNSSLFLSYRRTSAEDISLQYMSNQLKASLAEKSGGRLQEASDTKGKKLYDIVNAEQNASLMAENAIDRRIANLELHQKVNYSSVSVNMYQANLVYKEIVTNSDISSYKPAFGERFSHALKTGWNGLLAFFLFLVNIWPVFVMLFIMYALIKQGKMLFFKGKNINQ